MQSFNLNLVPGGFQPVFNASQGDIGREAAVTIYNGAAAYSIPSEATVKIEATKPSGLGFSVDCSFDGSVVSIETTETMTNEWGRFPAELVITQSGDVLGTANFVFNVEKSPHPEGTTDGDAETLVPQLTALVERIEESNAKVETMTASATRIATGGTPTAAYDPDTNNLEFGIPSPVLQCTDPDDDGNIVITFS